VDFEDFPLLQVEVQQLVCQGLLPQVYHPVQADSQVFQ
jgi:hypothetical protein